MERIGITLERMIREGRYPQIKIKKPESMLELLTQTQLFNNESLSRKVAVCQTKQKTF